MTSIEAFAAESRAVFTASGSQQERLERIAARLSELVREPGFAEAHFHPGMPYKTELHHDPDTDIYILAHEFKPGVGGNPHTHAPSWAIYANVRGSTLMREYERQDAADASHSELRITCAYTMKPGDARAYPPEAIHSPHHEETAWVIRITGGDLDKLDRWRFKKGRDRIVT